MRLWDNTRARPLAMAAATVAAAAFALTALAGCNPAAKFRVVEVSEPTFGGDIEAVNGTAVVENASGRDLTVEGARIVLRYRDRELGTARLLLPVAVPAGARARIRYDLAVEGLSAAEVRALGTRLLLNPGAVTADVTARVRWGAWCRNVRLENVPIVELVAAFSSRGTP